MKTTFLEFEQPIAELENRIEELRFGQDDSAVDISEEIQRLTKRSQSLTKDIYGKLNPWQVAQVARHPQRPYTLDYIQTLFPHLEELHGARAPAEPVPDGLQPDAVRALRGAARRPRVRRRSLDRGRPRPLRRRALHG